MSQPPFSHAERLQHLSDELDVLASRSGSEPPVPPEEIEAIFAEHEAECLVLEKSECGAERARGSRRV